MAIPTQMSLHGFIASQPQLTFTDKGTARLHIRVGVEHFRKEPDDTFTQLHPTYHDLVVFGTTAERAYARFTAGDEFVASGYIHEYELDKNGTAESREEFVARRIGHDLARTRYAVQRGPSHRASTPTETIGARAEPPAAVGI